MTLEYEICKQLKEIGLEQSGKCGWWIDKECSPQMDGKQGKSIAFSKHKYETNDEYYSVPQTDQLITWLEGKEWELDLQFSFNLDINDSYPVWRVMAFNFQNCDKTATPKATSEIYEIDLKTALAKLCIELERE